jgi:hypothetical protein
MSNQPKEKQMSAEPAAAPEPQKPDLEAVPDDDDIELYVDAGGQISLVAGGRQADESTIVFRGGEITVNGEFEKGQRLTFQIEGVVSEITFTDRMERKTGDVTGTKRKHVMKLDGITKVDN